MNNIYRSKNNRINENVKNNRLITCGNNTSNSNIEFPKISNIHYSTNANINKLTLNLNKTSFYLINDIRKLNIEDKKVKTKLNFSSPKISSLYQRHNNSNNIYLRRPLSNFIRDNNIEQSYSPKTKSVPKYLKTENNNSNLNIIHNSNNYKDNYSISTRKDNIFLKINNIKDNKYMNLLKKTKRKLSDKIKQSNGSS